MECSEGERLLNHGLVGTLGGVCFQKISDTEFVFRVEVKEIHLNSASATHGGFIMTFLDSGMGTAVRHSLVKGKRAVTISLNVQFMAATGKGDILQGTARIRKRTRSLFFLAGEVRSGDKIVASAEGIWKII